MDPETLLERARRLAEEAGRFAEEAEQLSAEAARLSEQAAQAAAQSTVSGIDPTVLGITVFVLACFVGYYVVWRVTPALHSPLMSVTNAVSSVIIVGALIAAGPQGVTFAKVMGVLAVTLASVNIFGGFIVTQRMLQMFRRKQR